MTKNNTVPTLAWSLVAILSRRACCWRGARGRRHRRRSPPNVTNDSTRESSKMLEPTQGEQDWSEVIAGWDELLTEKDLCERQVREIQRHHRNAVEGQKASPGGGQEFKRPAGEIRGQPERSTERASFLDYYPTGRRTQGVACFNVNGMGSNEGWFLRGDVYFAYQYEVLVETTVTKNTGKDAVFEVRISPRQTDQGRLRGKGGTAHSRGQEPHRAARVARCRCGLGLRFSYVPESYSAPGACDGATRSEVAEVANHGQRRVIGETRLAETHRTRGHRNRRASGKPRRLPFSHDRTCATWG